MSFELRFTSGKEIVTFKEIPTLESLKQSDIANSGGIPIIAQQTMAIKSTPDSKKIVAKNITDQMTESSLSENSPISLTYTGRERSDMKESPFSSACDNEFMEELFLLMPHNYRAQNFVTPNLNQEQRLNLEEFKKLSRNFEHAVENGCASPQILTSKQEKEIKISYKKMTQSAKRIYDLVDFTQGIDFFSELKKIIQKNEDLFADIRPYLKHINKELSSVLIINYKDVRHDSWANKLEKNIKDISKEPYPSTRKTEKKMDPKEIARNLEIKKIHLDQEEKPHRSPKRNSHPSSKKYSINLEKKNIILEPSDAYIRRKREEMNILFYYRETMLELAKNLEKIGNNCTVMINSLQKSIIEKIGNTLLKVFNLIKKCDKHSDKLNEIFVSEKIEKQSYKSIIYGSIAKVIRTQLIDHFWIKKNIQIQIDIIAKHSKNLKEKNFRSAFFYKDCLTEFKNSLEEQKYDSEFLDWWYAMSQEGMVCHIKPEKSTFKIIQQPKKIATPPQSASILDEEYNKQLEEYNIELKQYMYESISNLSEYAFLGDKTLLEDFFKELTQIIFQLNPQLKPPTNALEMHAQYFEFLGNFKIVDSNFKEDLNNKLKEKHDDTIVSLEQIAKNKRLQESMAVEMIIKFISAYYRSLNHKYIMNPLSNLKESYSLIYPKHGQVIKELKTVPMKLLSQNPTSLPVISSQEKVSEELKKIKNNGNHDARRIYIVLDKTSFEVHSVRVDGIVSSKGFLMGLLFTYTKVHEPYPGEDAKYDHSIEFSYKRINLTNLAMQLEELQKIEEEFEEKIRLLGFILEAAGFPSFVERLD